MRLIFLTACVLLCLLILSGCDLLSKSQPTTCQDPIGCDRFDKAQPIKVGVVAPRTDPHTCPLAAEAVEGIQAVFSDQTIADHPISVVVEDSRNDLITAQQRMNDLAEDPATVGLFYLDCSQDPGRVAQTAADAGIPGFVNQLPEKIEGIYPIFPSVDAQADRIVWLLDPEVDGSLLVAVDALDGPEELSRQVCNRWREQKGSCTVETFSEDLLYSFYAGSPSSTTETLLVLSSRADSLAGTGETPVESRTVFWFNPLFSQPPDHLNQPENTGQAEAAGQVSFSPQYQSTWFVVQSAKSLLEAVRTAAQDGNTGLYLPRQAVLDYLDQLSFAGCNPQAGPSCPDSFDYTLYPFRNGILIINP